MLVIDADTAGRGIVRSRLVDAGHEVHVAQDAGRGIEAALAGGLDAVLVAARLEGDCSGVDVCHDLRGHPDLQDTPLLVYALAEAPEDLVPRALDAGAHAVVAPDQAPQLERVVEASLTSRKRVAALRERQRILRLEQRHLANELRRCRQGLPADSTDADSPRGPSAAHPDGLLLVDAAGVVRWSDRGAWSMLGAPSVGTSLRRIAPASGLDEFVGGARHGPRHGHLFDLPGPGGWPARPLIASVHPAGELRVVLLNDRRKRRVATEVVLDQEPALPRPQVASLIDAAAREYGLDRVPGDDAQAAALRAGLVARTRDREPLLLVGEAGTGRRFLARVLHYQGPGAGPFLELRCPAFAPDTLEAELFGGGDPQGGAARPGLLLLAGAGSVLLHEVDALPAASQARLLEVLRSGQVRQEGTARAEPVLARMLATTSEHLDHLAARGRFDAELAEHLGRQRLNVPPLRARGSELPGIVLERLTRLGGTGIEYGALARLVQHDWPGNLTELDQTLEAGVRAARGASIGIQHLPPALGEPAAGQPGGDRVGEGGAPAGGAPPRANLPWSIGAEDPISFEFYERQAIVRALAACRGDRLAAARLLQVGKSTLYRKIQRFGLE